MHTPGQCGVERNGADFCTSGDYLVYARHNWPLNVRSFTAFRFFRLSTTLSLPSVVFIWFMQGTTGYMQSLTFKETTPSYIHVYLVQTHSMHFRFSTTCISKSPECRAKQTIIWTSEEALSVCKVLLSVKWPKSVSGHSVHFLKIVNRSSWS